MTDHDIVRWREKYRKLDRLFPRVRLLETVETNGGDVFKKGTVLRVVRTHESTEEYDCTGADGREIGSVKFEDVRKLKR